MIRHAIVAAVAAVAGHALGAAPVAFVADVSGSATIAGDGPVHFLAELEPGTRLFIGTGARVTVTFARSGSEFTAMGPGEFVLDEAALRAERGTQPARREVTSLPDTAVIARVSRSATASLRMRGVRSSAAPKASPWLLEYPVDARVATLQPVLRWRWNAEIRDAKVSLRDESGKEVWAGNVSAGTVKPAVKLSAATRYTWTVRTANGFLGEARFETLPPERLAAADKSRASARSFPERVMHAVVLHDLGADQDARQAWAELARERPDLPELARLAD